MPGARIEADDDVALRTVEQEDAPLVQRAYANAELRQPLGRRPKNRDAVESHIDAVEADHNREQFLVCVEDEDAPAGPSHEDSTSPIGVVLVRDVTRRPNLAIWLLPEHHGNGYGRTAASLAIGVIFRSFDVPSIGAGVYEFNDASRALMESLGFTREGRQRRVQFHDGEYHDNLKYGLLREEWEQRGSD